MQYSLIQRIFKDIVRKMPQEILKTVSWHFRPFKINNTFSLKQVLNNRFIVEQAATENTCSFKRNI